ncbi:MAG: hypothetical protein SPG94_03515 [Candidatus Enterosoma sp.]|nr:hypothetical protein [bacterium]MDY5548347.1 hypothetical protein [Candidatus Enterosoma sp.]
MEEENIPTECHRQRTYTEGFIKSVVKEYETRRGEYTSTSAYSREKGIPALYSCCTEPLLLD